MDDLQSTTPLAIKAPSDIQTESTRPDLKTRDNIIISKRQSGGANEYHRGESQTRSHRPFTLKIRFKMGVAIYSTTLSYP